MMHFQNFATIIDLAHIIEVAIEDLDDNETEVEYLATKRAFKTGTPLAALFAEHDNAWHSGANDAYRYGVTRSQYIAFHLVEHLA